MQSEREALDAIVVRLRDRLAMATPGPWMVQDGCSWRRIGTHEHDGDVLCPTNHPRDNHPDLIAVEGKLYANLMLIVEAVNALPALLDALALRPADQDEGWRTMESAPRDPAQALFEHEMRCRQVTASWADLDGDERAGWQDSVNVVLRYAATSTAEWQTVKSHKGHGSVLVGAWNEFDCFVQGAAFLDVTGVWRVLHSFGGMAPLPFAPTHWMPLPAAPALDRKDAAS